MQAFDASSMIYAWDNYPPKQFPPLWKWMHERIGAREFCITSVAFEEVERKIQECGSWLKDIPIEVVDVDNPILEESLRIKQLLGIQNDNYHPSGVGENDILIIAAAKICGHELISNENRQVNMPQIMAKRKIPAACARYRESRLLEFP